MKRSRAGARNAVERIRAVDTASDSGHSSGNLAKILLKRRAWGELASTAVQEFAAAAVKDGARCHRLAKLASLGCNGEYPGNCERDLDSDITARRLS